MPEKLIIIGGGPAATNALETIRHFTSTAEVTLICDEPVHSRMALPYWLSGQIPEAQTHTGDAGYFRRLQIDARIGQRVTELDGPSRCVTLDSGETLPFDKLLIATGSSPTSIPIPGIDLPGVEHLWTLDQTARVLQAAYGMAHPRVVMIGAGFIGLIVLNAMYKRGWKLAVVERETQLLPRMLDATAASYARDWLATKQVDVHCGASVQAIDADDQGSKRVWLADGCSIPADIVIVAAGVRPNLNLVAGTEIAVDHGILVDDRLQTNVAGIFAAGDVAQGPVRWSDRREVHAIQPTAVDHGRVAGANLAGETIRYAGSLSMNVLDVCGLQGASFGQCQDFQADTMTIANERDYIYRALHWTDDRVTGAMFVGRANNLGMLTDVGMVKGLIQTGVRMGEWKAYLRENPFDIRRAFIARDVPRQLMAQTLLGIPAGARQYRFDKSAARHQPSASHQIYVQQKS
jgi:NAD(P)H-nitrite reductase large subunit